MRQEASTDGELSKRFFGSSESNGYSTHKEKIKKKEQKTTSTGYFFPWVK